MNREEWALLVIAAADGAPVTPVQLQKSLFLIGREFPEAVGPSFYRFVPHNYGPFDSDVYADADLLAKRGLVAIQCPPGQGWAEYSCTRAGMDRSAELRAGLDANLVDYIQQVVSWTRKQTFTGLVRAIYAKYPEFRANSVFRD